MALSEIKKTIINVLTIAVTAGPWVLDALNLFPGGLVAATFVSSLLGIAGVILHYLVPNTTDDPVKAKTQSMVYKPDLEAKRAARKVPRRRTTAAAHPHVEDVVIDEPGKHEK